VLFLAIGSDPVLDLHGEALSFIFILDRGRQVMGRTIDSFAVRASGSNIASTVVLMASYWCPI
jgi:hypothetical protein